MTVKDIASQSSDTFETRHDLRDAISWFDVSPGSAETLVMRGGITNQHSMACSLSSISARNYQNWL